METFELISDYLPKGDQPQAIDKLTTGLLNGNRFQSLLGVTGSGKTFTMANVIQEVQRPTLVISPNKTLAAQLYNEFRDFFPNNAVHYFVSYSIFTVQKPIFQQPISMLKKRWTSTRKLTNYG